MKTKSTEHFSGKNNIRMFLVCIVSISMLAFITARSLVAPLFNPLLNRERGFMKKENIFSLEKKFIYTVFHNMCSNSKRVCTIIVKTFINFCSTAFKL